MFLEASTAVRGVYIYIYMFTVNESKVTLKCVFSRERSKPVRGID